MSNRRKSAFCSNVRNIEELENSYFYFNKTIKGTMKLWDIDSRELYNDFTTTYSFEELKNIKVFGVRDIKKGYGLKEYKTLNGFLKEVKRVLSN